MPNIDPRPFGGNAYASGVYGSPNNPTEWQHQPGDHSDTGILPLLTPVSGTGGVSFGFSLAASGAETFTGTGGVTFGFSTSGTGTETFTGSGGVAFGFALAASGTVTTEPTTFCDYDFADDTYDNAADTCDCSAITPTTAPNAGGYRRPPRYIPPAPDDDEDVLVLAAVMRHRFRL